MEKAFKNYNDVRENTATKSKEIEKQISLNESKIKDAKTAAKELGVNIKDIKGVSVLEDSNNDLAREINLLDYPAIR